MRGFHAVARTKGHQDARGLRLLKKILFLLTAREKRRGGLVLLMTVIMAGLEVTGVASVMPFLSVLGNPEVVTNNPILSWSFDRLGFATVEGYLVALGAVAFCVIVLSALFRSLTHYAMNRFIELRRHSIGERLLETYLRQPYTFFLNRHTSDLAKGILSEVDQLVNQVFRPGLLMIAYAIVASALIGFLIAVDPVLAIVVATVVGIMYGAIYLAVRGILGRAGRDRVNANEQRFTAAGEALGGIKDIKILGREEVYLGAFRGPSIRQAKHQATSQTAAQVPKFLIEAVGVGGVIVLTLVLIRTQGRGPEDGLGQLLPVLGMYAFAGYRLLPAAQHIYQGFARIRFGAAAVESVYNDLRQRSQLAEIRQQPRERIAPIEFIELRDMSFTYPNVSTPALQGVNLTIPMGSSIGIVGTTGSGKTTLIDLILGLLRPSQGAIVVDGQEVCDEDVPAWQKALGYVPQEIFLSDSTIAENIALGVPKAEMDADQIRLCARLAHAHDFIENELAHGFDTVVGERGIRLSGGQCQRIGIARALYHEPAILVFDEATSALDNGTEKAVMDAIGVHHADKTLIMVAHRLSTIRECDNVAILHRGELVGEGRFEELRRSSTWFNAMTAAAGIT